MMNRLQFRLLFSFLVVLLVTLGIIGVILLVFLRTRPVPVEDTYNELTVTSLDTDLVTLQQTLRRQGESISMRDVQRRLEEARQLLDEYATTTSERLLLVTLNRRVLYDSTGRLGVGEDINLVNQPPPVPPRADSQTSFLTFGTFTEDGQEWIYVSRRILDVSRGQPGGQNPNAAEASGIVRVIDYVVATPRPQQTIRRVVDNYGEVLFLPLCQAGVIGMVIAALLSIWISRSVAKPLQGIASAAGRVAAGDYDQRVPVTGPTEARIVARAFNEMTAQVEETQQAQQDFLANVTHDLRTPLTSIQGFSQAIIDGVAAQPEAAQHSAQIINEEASRLNRLVNDLLDIAKIQAGRLQMLRQAVEVDRLLRMVGESMTIKAQQKNIQLHLQIPTLQRIAGDGDRLAQVFTNLVDNAVKHTDPDGQVWLIAKPEPGGILVQVQDTGEGIPQEDLSRIFERFYQVDKSRNRAAQNHGAGLGLSITYEIVRAHGGKIHVESQIGVGTRFSVWLPTLSPEHSTVVSQRRN